MAYYECAYKDDHISIDDNFIVTLSGSHNQITTATVCYIDKTTVCLLGDINLGETTYIAASNYIWNYIIDINNKEYTGTCKIPTVVQIYSKCAGYKRNFAYWTSTVSDSSVPWFVSSDGYVGLHGGPSIPYGTVPFIEITL